MKNGRLQAKDIDDRKVLEIVSRLSRQIYWPWDGSHVPHWVMRWEIERELGFRDASNEYGSIPTERLVRAKCDALIRRGLLDGCTCGCRGDFELTDAGKRLLDVDARLEGDTMRPLLWAQFPQGSESS